MTAEEKRLAEAGTKGVPWRKWGPYLSERQWGTVREDYSVDGNAWDYLTHDQARSRAYHWGEDGLAGISDDQQQLCFALALWNGQDPILKERLFGLTNAEGNHGEDVKEYYFYLDSTPTHSYMKWLYKYPQTAFPYDDLVATNRRRQRKELEYELIDTGVFADDRYFDVQVEYTKVATDDILIRITATNRGGKAAPLHVLPTIWFRNTWQKGMDGPRPSLQEVTGPGGTRVIATIHPDLGHQWLYVDGDAPLLFTENDTNNERLFGKPNEGPFVKDGINDFVVHGRTNAVNPARVGTKAAVQCEASVEPGQAAVWRLRLSNRAPEDLRFPFADFDSTVELRLSEADEFYDALVPRSTGPDEKRVIRQAMAGMLWSKQYYFLDTGRWLVEHGLEPFSAFPSNLRNEQWAHMVNANVISMPDKWDTPGTRRGTWRFIRLRCRRWTSTSRKNSST